MSSRRRAVLLLVVLGAVGVLAAGMRLWTTGTALADALTAARASLTEIEDVDELPGAVDEAEAHLQRARGLAGRPVWRLAGHVPPASASVRTVDAVVDLAGASVALGSQTVPLIDLARNELGSDDGRIDPDTLLELRDAAETLDLAPMRAAVERVERQSTTAVPGRVLEGRREALAAGADLLAGAERARAGARVAVDLLGAEEPREHLLAMQNPAELRGTGGLIGQVGVLSADRGAVELHDVRSYTELVGEPVAPEHLAAPTAFEQRYGHVEASTFFGNVNVDPDLPTVAPVALSLYRAQTGRQLDSVILVDPLALEALLEATGPVELPEDVAGDLPSPIDSDQVAEVAMVDAYVALGGRDERRQRFLGVLAGRVFEELTRLDPGDPELLEALADAAAGRHLQIASTESGVQRDLERLGVAGRLPDAEETDLVAVTANNAGANKQDVHVAHGLSIELALGEPRRLEDGSVTASRETSYELVVDNPLEEGDLTPYVIGSAPADREPFVGQVGPEALNRTWFTVWEPEDSELLGATAEAGDPRIASSAIDGRRGFDHHLETQGPGRGVVGLRTRTWVRLRETDDGLRYLLTVWRQPKGIADELDLRVQAPPSWRIADAQLETHEGGPTPLRRPGDALGLSDPPRLTTETTSLRLRGAMTADLRLVVDLER